MSGYLPEEVVNTVSNAGLIVFDYDSTMANTRNVNFTTYQRLFEPYGIDVGFEEYAAGFGKSPVEHCRIIAEAHQRQDLNPEDIAAGFEETVIQLMYDYNVKLFDYVEEVLCLAKCPIVIATDNASVVVEEALLGWGIYNRINRVISGQDTKVPKVQRLQELADEYDRHGIRILFEDSPSMLKAARPLGYVTVGIVSEGRDEKELNKCCDAIIGNC